MTNKHTPSPWTVCGRCEDKSIAIREDASGFVVAVALCQRGYVPNVEHNARLIAAAPELLEALEIYFSAESEGVPIQGTGFKTKALIAIKKAKGE